MKLIVQKYGGSSLATPRHICEVAQRIQQLKKGGTQVVVVASAMGHMTDHLIRLAHKTVRSPLQRELDMLMTAGERVSMSLLAMALDDMGVPAISFTGSQSGIITTSHHNEARILEIRADRILQALSKNRVAIVAGFQGVSREKEITTLGRGGSDTSAVALAAALKAERCEILTDVEGLYTADPRRVPHARPIPYCTYPVALELARLGAKMHPRSIVLAARFNVPLWITSSKTLNGRFTYLTNERMSKMETNKVQGVTTQDHLDYYVVRTDLSSLTKMIKATGIALQGTALSSDSVRFLVDGKNKRIENFLQHHSIPFDKIENMGVVSIVLDGISDPQHLPTFLETLEECNLKPLLLSTGTTFISAAIRSQDLSIGAQALHRRFLE